MNNVDYELFNKRLEDIERSLKVLQAYVEYSTLKDKYYVDNGDVAYVLKKGSLADAGLKQEWTGPVPPTTEYIGGKKKNV